MQQWEEISARTVFGIEHVHRVGSMANLAIVVVRPKGNATRVTQHQTRLCNDVGKCFPSFTTEDEARLTLEVAVTGGGRKPQMERIYKKKIDRDTQYCYGVVTSKASPLLSSAQEDKASRVCSHIQLAYFGCSPLFY